MHRSSRQRKRIGTEYWGENAPFDILEVFNGVLDNDQPELLADLFFTWGVRCRDQRGL